jgi:hypothetical protein
MSEYIIKTDMDSDRLVRILVTEVLQSYGTNAGQVTDWYAFANSIKVCQMNLHGIKLIIMITAACSSTIDGKG